MLFKMIIRAIIDAVFPPRCPVCRVLWAGHDLRGRAATEGTSQPASSFFCPSCAEFSRIVSPICSRCGLPFVSRQGEDHTCSECLTEKRYFRKARAFGVYAGNLMQAVHRFKYGRNTALAGPLGELVRQTFLQWWNAEDVDLIVPVPLHLRRLRERGFNQAYLLIRKWAKREGIAADGLFLGRHRHTEPQTVLSRADRRKNIRGAFSVRHPERVKDRNILLVDDVYTTGSTVNECARVLTKAGAASVDVLTLARAA